MLHGWLIRRSAWRAKLPLCHSEARVRSTARAAVGFLKRQIAHYILPESIERFEEFPLTRSGKYVASFARLGPRSSQCIGLVDHASALNSGPLLNAAQC